MLSTLLMFFMALSATGARMSHVSKYLASALVPRYVGAAHKGSHGRVAVIGGSVEYTGAPYYAAISSLKAGGDLAYVLCTAGAATAIKSYSPELIVLPILPSGPGAPDSKAVQEVLDVLGRVHSVVIGPGLGRNDATLRFIGAHVLPLLAERDIPTVLDGDALWLLSAYGGGFGRSKLLAETGGPTQGSARLDAYTVTDTAMITRGYRAHSFILTPNPMELSRLLQAWIKGRHAEYGYHKQIGALLPDAEAQAAEKRLRAKYSQDELVAMLSEWLGGAAIVAKGGPDSIVCGLEAVRVPPPTMPIPTAGSPFEDYLDAAAAVMLGSNGPTGQAGASGAAPFISSGRKPPAIVHTRDNIGSPRRCGGQGDVLAGTIGVMLAWAKSTGLWDKSRPTLAAASAANGSAATAVAADGAPVGSTAAAPASVSYGPGVTEEQVRPLPNGTLRHSWSEGPASLGGTPSRAQLLVAAGYGGATYTRIAAQLAFEQHGRSTTTPNIIEQLGKAIEGGSNQLRFRPRLGYKRARPCEAGAAGAAGSGGASTASQTSATAAGAADSSSHEAIPAVPVDDGLLR